MPGSLAAEAVGPRLRGRFGRDYRFVPACDSTQLLLPENAPEGAVAAADEQLTGRGRLGRRWLAPSGTSLLFSIVLRPRVAGERLPELSIVAGRAVAAAIHGLTGLVPELKFPNDVLVDGRKVGGILAEAREGRVVLGIGVNVDQEADALPDRTEIPATSLRLETETPVDRAELLAAVLAELEREYDAWNQG
jgi:BirA family transcriptional regulator, biotin operon repressor / biotin---[acetyl-CoA-carboxylase] ligase